VEQEPEFCCGPSRYGRDPADLLRRLARVEGQVRGLARMVQEDRYCVDVLVQIAAVRSALQAVGASLLQSHVRHCVAAALGRGDGEAAVAELLEVVGRFSG